MVLSIGYFERYVNSKSDYLELLLSVYYLWLIRPMSSDTFLVKASLH